MRGVHRSRLFSAGLLPRLGQGGVPRQREPDRAKHQEMPRRGGSFKVAKHPIIYLTNRPAAAFIDARPIGLAVCFPALTARLDSN